MRSLMLFILTASLSFAQLPRLGTIEFYGVRKTPVAKLRKALGLQEGDNLPASKATVEDALQTLPTVVQARLEAICCEGNRAILYVGIEERGAPHFEVRPPTTGAAVLPAEIGLAYTRFLGKLGEAAKSGTAAEDLSRGYSLVADDGVRIYQLQFLELAKQHIAALREVLHYGPDEEQRAMAAYVIGYAPERAKVIGELQYALQDADDTVRANALRALSALAVYARVHPEEKLRVSPTWFVEMLNSISWNERNNAVVTLVNLTETPDPELLGLLRERALPSLTEMARWKHLAHALPSCILLGRIAGLPEKEIQELWSKGQREAIIARTKK